jgi:D-alanyl-D-alanine carboxypeptidase/D-alanyl-D-alanine-endopeptidase (penicillin-binding protein 4)
MTISFRRFRSRSNQHTNMRRAALILLSVCAIALASHREGEARDRVRAGTLADRLAARVGETAARPGRVGAMVVDLDTGTVVFERDAATPLIPASLAKVATTVAALDLLGPGHVYVTTLSARGAFDSTTGTLSGDLVLRGSGDPGLSNRDHDADPMWPLSTFAAAAAKVGVKRVTGAVVLDDGPFDREYVHPTWTASDLSEWYGAPVAGLTFNDGCATVRVRGGASEGAPPTVTAPTTAGPWPIAPEVRTVEARDAQVGGAFAYDRSRLRVFGMVGPGVERDFQVPVPEPLQFVGAAMVAALRAAGVEVAHGARPVTPADRAPGAPSAPPEPAEELARVEHGLVGTLRVMDRRSQNLYAALVFKACGAEREPIGSWGSGERAVMGALERRGVVRDGLRVVDGSGLSKDNRLSAAALVRMLVSVDRDALRGPVLRDVLAVPGEDGTLEKRFRDMRPASARGRIHAKTGTLGRSGVHSIAGYVDGPDPARRGFAFAFLCNDGRVDGRGLVDDLVRLLIDG